MKEIQILTSMGHSSLSKAASVVGLGRQSVKELPAGEDEPWKLDLDAVERELSREGVASIIVISAGEVNTGRFATHVFDMPKLPEPGRPARGVDPRRWRYVGAADPISPGPSTGDYCIDLLSPPAAFGIFARALLPHGRVS